MTLKELFKVAKMAKKTKVDPRTTHVVFLSGLHTSMHVDGQSVTLSEYSSDIVARAEYAVSIWRELQEATMVLVGETNQLAPMLEMVLKAGVPANKIVLVDCLPRPLANTKTQLESIDNDERLPAGGTYVLITTCWHSVRVNATAHMHLKRIQNWQVVGVPYTQYDDFNWEKVVAGEIARIHEYSAKGDIVDPTTL